MSENKRFQKRKLNKDAGKGVKKAAKGTKVFLEAGAFLAVAIPTIKKFGKPVLEAGKKIIFKS